jgi:hypothetical protein
MALTLQQRVNLSKGTPLTDEVTFTEKCSQEIKKIAQDLLNGGILISDACFDGHPVTQNQVYEWSLRALRGSMDQMMVPMIMDATQMPADPNNATDLQFRNATKASLWPYITLIGTGVL